MDTAETFGQRLRRLRKAAGLTQRDLAGDRLDPSYVSLLEADRRPPTQEVVRVLASALGCSRQFLQEGVEDPEETLLMAQAEVGLGRPSHAVARLAPVMESVADASISRDFEFRAAEVYASALERSGDLDGSIKWLERLYAAAECDPRQFPLLRVSLALVRCHRDAGDLIRAISVGEKALGVYRSLGLSDSAACGGLIATIASAYAYAGELAHASVLLEELARSAEGSGDLKTQAYAYWNAAFTAGERGDVAEGQRLIEKAISLIDATEDLRSRSRIRVTQAWLLLHQVPPDPAAAREILRKELPELRQHDGAPSLAGAESELALCELLLGRPSVARRLASASLKRLADTHRLERGRAGAIHGASLVALGETATGVSEIEESVQLLVDAGARRQAASTLTDLSAVYATLGDLSAALDCSRRALALVGIVPNAGSSMPMHLNERESKEARGRRNALVRPLGD